MLVRARIKAKIKTVRWAARMDRHQSWQSTGKSLDRRFRSSPCAELDAMGE